GAPLPWIQSPANASILSDLRPTLTAQVTDSGGSGVDTSSIVLKLDSAPVARTLSIVNPNTVNVTFTPSADLAEGSHTVVVGAADRAGNVGVPVQISFIIDVNPPALTLSPSEGQRLVNSKPTLMAPYSAAGVGVELSTFKAFLDGTEISSSFITGPSQSTFTPATPLADGPHLFRAEIADKLGKTTQASSLFRLSSALATVGGNGG